MSNAPEHTRDRILEAARDLYLEAGLAGFSMRRVARGAGVTATAIYRHFENKEALLLAVASSGFERFARYLYRGLEGASPRERLLLTGRGYMCFALEQPGYYRVMFMSSAEDIGFADMSEKTTSRLAPTFLFLVDRVRECMDAGAFSPEDPVSVAATVWSTVHGLVSLHLTGKLLPAIETDEQFADFYQASLLRLLDGLVA